MTTKKKIVVILIAIYVWALISNAIYNPEGLGELFSFGIFVVLCYFGWKAFKNRGGKEYKGYGGTFPPLPPTQKENRTLEVKDTRPRQPYRKKDYLLSITERKFYYALERVAQENQLHLFAKVRLEDLLWLPENIENRFGLRNRIKSRHIDFVLCDYRDVKPILAIELDDSSHLRFDRVERDNFVNDILKDAGLPILHFPTKRFYDPQEIAQKIIQNLSNLT